MKTYHVVAAIIKKDDKFFVTQRGYGEFKDYWEFPGGKIEIGENDSQALKREIKEELDAEISLDKFIMTVDYTYPNFHLIMECYLCSLINDSITLIEAEDARFVSKDELDSIDFLPADKILIEELKKL